MLKVLTKLEVQGCVYAGVHVRGIQKQPWQITRIANPKKPHIYLRVLVS